APTPAVELAAITKRFGAVVACNCVDLRLHRGRIHGILGENGAGKSTLMKILIGLVMPDVGSIHIDGARCQIVDPLDAAARGIGMVHQHFSLVDPLTVWENVALGDAGRLDPTVVRRRIGEISEQYGLDIDPDARVGDLTAGLRQRVEIIKCLRRNPSIVVFDEPTSVLTPDESQQLFASLRQVVADEDRAVVLVSHKLDEILHATDEVTIMRQGAVVERMRTIDADAPTLARAMVGRPVSLRSERAALGLVVDHDEQVEAAADVVESQVSSIAPVLEVRAVTVVGTGGVRLLDELTVEVHPGEIVGVAGVEGNGQRVLGDLLSSLVALTSGTVLVNGSEISTRRPGALARAGVAVIPEDRHDSGVVLDMTVAENLVAIDPALVTERGVFDRDAMRAHARRMIDEFDIQCAGPDAPLWTLSGGNQQRVVLARELSLAPSVLVAAQPTRGLDVGAIEYMGGRLRQAAREGVGVLLISSELEEILELSHRIVVMHRGRIVGEMPRSRADLERIGLLMGGVAA
ncbi:MAG TPA: ABC transporter ATP-binding protein, partial [Ilumatobacter sp.]|nr:ABC transporter ATP-binding protein [Ilumatobacter sp.]